MRGPLDRRFARQLRRCVRGGIVEDRRNHEQLAKKPLANCELVWLA